MEAAEELESLCRMATLPHAMFPRLKRLTPDEALPFNVSVIRAARRCRLMRVEMLKGHDTTAEQMTVGITGRKYVEG